MGDALLQKKYTVDVFSKKRVNNNGIVPQYYVENSHEAIIPRELFMQTQKELNRRSELRKNKNKSKKKRVYSGQYAFSNVLVCSECGDLYRRVAWNNKASISAKWRCATRITDGPEACKGESLEESEIQNAVHRALNQTFAGKNNVREVL